MAMKVIGTGAPRMLTVRFRPCEVGVVLDELHHQRSQSEQQLEQAALGQRSVRVALPLPARAAGGRARAARPRSA
jgi:hypothetical protein